MSSKENLPGKLRSLSIGEQLPEESTSKEVSLDLNPFYFNIEPEEKSDFVKLWSLQKSVDFKTKPKTELSGASVKQRFPQNDRLLSLRPPNVFKSYKRGSISFINTKILRKPILNYLNEDCYYRSQAIKNPDGDCMLSDSLGDLSLNKDLKADIPTTNDLISPTKDRSTSRILTEGIVLTTPPSSSRLEHTAVGEDDVNITELSSYLDNIVHIPKEMSPMAEMMYI